MADGKHQTGPIWFSVEAVDVNVALEANGKLVVAPSDEAVIDMHLLRANMPMVQEWQIQFVVTKQPRFGQLFLRDKPTERFTQQNINQRLLTYRQNRVIEKQWQVEQKF